MENKLFLLFNFIFMKYEPVFDYFSEKTDYFYAHP
jgi:hypothetical protein